AAKLVVTAKKLCVDPGLDDRELVRQLLVSHIFSMRSELIELRAWTAVCVPFFLYNYKRGTYVEELQRRHPADHRCPLTKSSELTAFYRITRHRDLSSGPRASQVPALEARDSASDSGSDSLGDSRFRGVTTAYHLGSARPAETSLFSGAAIYPSSGLVRRRRRPSLSVI
ncbi:hypothetical protein DFH06DRAFT_1202256, partial [Mycena polygramma]